MQQIITIFTQASQQIGRGGLPPMWHAIFTLFDRVDRVAFGQYRGLARVR